MRTSPFERSYTVDTDREATTRYLEELESGQIVHPEIEDAFIRSAARYSLRLGVTADASIEEHIYRLGNGANAEFATAGWCAFDYEGISSKGAARFEQVDHASLYQSSLLNGCNDLGHGDAALREFAAQSISESDRRTKWITDKSYLRYKKRHKRLQQYC